MPTIKKDPGQKPVNGPKNKRAISTTVPKVEKDKAKSKGKAPTMKAKKVKV